MGFDAPRPRFGGPAHDRGCPRPMTGKAAARHRRAAKLAADLCPDLPDPGGHVHCLMTGYFDLGQVVCDVARRTAPRRLRVATLCWSKRNVTDFARLLADRAGDSLPITLLASGFFARQNKELADWSRRELAPLGVTMGFAESHAKVVCFDLGPGDALVFEGSANLRTNRNREQITIIRDRDTHDWHAGWIDELVTRGEDEDGRRPRRA